MTKPITIYAHASGPNPWKSIVILEELGLPYEPVFMDMSKLKEDPYESKNPNGRLPLIEDPNTGISLWESGAINQYLIDTYDKEQKLSYGDKIPEKYYCNQWLKFQVSGQGPYFGQKAWFTFFHPEKNITSAIERYGNEIKRVVGVIDRHLAKQGTGWLVGDKCTYADLSFVTWNMMIPFLTSQEESDKIMETNPNFKKWHEAILARPAVKKVAEDKKKAMSGGH